MNKIRKRLPALLIFGILPGIFALHGAAPAVIIDSPSMGEQFEPGEFITVDIEATDADGNGKIVLVEVFNGGSSLGFAGLVDRDSGTWRFEFVPTAPGLIDLSVTATDDEGDTGTSGNVLVNLLTGFAPEVSIISLQNEEVVPVGGSVTLTAEVVGSNRPVTVEFFANGFPVGSAAEFPYTLEYAVTNEDPDLEITAVATEEGQGTAIANVTIQALENAPPTVEIIPVVSEFTLGSRIPVVAEAGDIDGQISQVQFFANNTLIATSTEGGRAFSADWRPTVAATYALKAVATDDVGNRAESTVSVVVNPRVGQPPIGSLFISPQEESYAIGAEIFLSADVADVDGTIANVSFLVNGALVGTATEEPYNVRYSFRDEDVSFIVAESTPDQLFSNVTVLVEDNDGNLAVVTTPVLIAPLTRRLPKIDITSPESGSIFGLGSEIALQGRLRTVDVEVDGVQFYEDQRLIGLVGEAPYEIRRVPEEAGSRVYEAIAFYSFEVSYVFPGPPPLEVVVPTLVSDISDESKSITLSAAGPFVQLLNPSEGDLLSLNQPITLTARAIASSGGALSVQFFVVENNVLVRIGGPDTQAPYAVEYTPATTGFKSIFARVEEAGVGTTDSNRSEVNVILDTTPAVSLSSPAEGSTFGLGNPVTLTADVTSTGSAISVDFFANGFLVGTDSDFPYSFQWTPPSSGRFSLTARVNQEGFGSSTSPGREIRVNPNEAPAITLSASETGIIVGDTVTFTAAASDSDGTITGIEFFANGISLGQVTERPFMVDWVPEFSGSFEISAVAEDNFGNQATSMSLFVTVSGLSDDRSFVLRSYDDLVNELPPRSDLDALESQLALGEITEAEVVERILEDPSFRTFREAIMTYLVITGRYPDRNTLIEAATVIQTQRELVEAEEPENPLAELLDETIDPVGVSGLESLVLKLESEFVKQFGDPFLLSNREYLSILFRNKYGREPSEQQLFRMLFLLEERDGDRNRMAAEFILDNTVVVTGVLSYTENLQISNPPNNNLVERADTAALFIDLLRVRPGTAEVDAILEEPLLVRIELVLADPRYGARFNEVLDGAIPVGSGWNRSEWFGTFNALGMPWLYHRDLHWLYLYDAIPLSGAWLWYDPLGWVWTSRERFPYLWSAEREGWFFYNEESQSPNWFYDFESANWVKLENPLRQ